MRESSKVSDEVLNVCMDAEAGGQQEGGGGRGLRVIRDRPGVMPSVIVPLHLDEG